MYIIIYGTCAGRGKRESTVQRENVKQNSEYSRGKPARRWHAKRNNAVVIFMTTVTVVRSIPRRKFYVVRVGGKNYYVIYHDSGVERWTAGTYEMTDARRMDLSRTMCTTFERRAGETFAGNPRSWNGRWRAWEGELEFWCRTVQMTREKKIRKFSQRKKLIILYIMLYYTDGKTFYPAQSVNVECYINYT